MAHVPEGERAIVFLDEKACRDELLVGGKASGLANLAERFRVPPGFCVTSAALSNFQHHDFQDSFKQSLRQAYETLGKRCGEESPSVAVRSSAVGEDSNTASFAGIHETYLNVTGAEALVKAVKDCTASAFSERAIEYRRQTLKTGEPQVAVLVQKLVPSEAAVVAFTANPVTGSQEELVINATLGLGETLVGGRVVPDTYVLRRADRAIIHRKIANKPRMLIPVSGGTGEADVPKHLQSSPALTDEQLSEVIDVALRVEETVGQPVDIEAAWSGGQLFLLQARPITTGFPVTLQGDEAELEWEHFVEHFPTVMPPLAGDTVRFVMEGMNAAYAERGVKARSTFRAFNGHVYAAWKWLIPDAEIPKAQEEAKALNRIRARELSRYWKDIAQPELAKEFAWIKETSVETLPSPDLAQAWEELWRRFLHVFTIHFRVLSPAFTAVEDLVDVYKSVFPDESPLEALKLTQGLLHSLNRLQRDLYALAAHARSSPAQSKLILADEEGFEGLEHLEGGPELLERLREFLKDHGHLGQLYWDLEQSAWEDEPSRVIGEVRRLLVSNAPDPEIDQRRLAEEAALFAERCRKRLSKLPEDLAKLEAALEVAREAGPLTEEHNYWIDHMLKNRERQFVLRVGDRLVRASVISQPSDIFFLHIDEIRDLIVQPQDYRSEILARRRRFEEWKKLRPPPYLGKRRAVERRGIRPSKGDQAEGREGLENGLLQGQAASVGVVRGPARIVLTTDDFPRVKHGDVLVCPLLEPSWVPLFSVAAGLVTNSGGVLSHAAVVARVRPSSCCWGRGRNFTSEGWRAG